MRTAWRIVSFSALLFCLACGKTTGRHSASVLQEAQHQYDSASRLLQSDSLKQAFPLLLQVADKVETLPEDMDSAAMQLTVQAYSQMAFVFRMKMENNAEIDALRRATGYQEQLADTLRLMHSWFGMAGAFETLNEPDSAQVCLNRVWPFTDTVKDAETYWQVLDLQSALCFDRGQYDSCFRICREMMAFKARRGMDTKNDSVGLGMFLFFSGNHKEAKPFLLKVLDADCDDVQTGYVMSLAMQVFEEEELADSVAFCQRYITTFVEAETERFDDGLALLKQYEQFKMKRDARLTTLRERKTARRRTAIAVALAMLVALAFALYHFWRKKQLELHDDVANRQLQEVHSALKTKEIETLRVKARGIYDDKRGNTCKRLMDLFDTAYPEAMGKLKESYPHLNDTEITVAVLAFLSFIVKETADIMDLRENTVAKYRTSVRKKTGKDDFQTMVLPFLG